MLAINLVEKVGIKIQQQLLNNNLQCLPLFEVYKKRIVNRFFTFENVKTSRTNGLLAPQLLFYLTVKILSCKWHARRITNNMNRAGYISHHLPRELFSLNCVKFTAPRREQTRGVFLLTLEHSQGAWRVSSHTRGLFVETGQRVLLRTLHQNDVY